MSNKAKDLTNQVFGELTAIKVAGKYRGGNVWECKCSCGNIIQVLALRLLSGHTKSCGHLKASKKNLIGQEFGRWTVTSKSEKKKYWICKCECGNIKEVYENNLISGKSKSCGCLQKEVIHELLYEALTGQIFGRWTVIGKSELGASYCKCKCACGTIKDINKQSLKNGDSTSCGCYKRELTSQILSLNLNGQKFGKLTVIERNGTIVGEDNTKYSSWLCQCECGNKKTVKGHDLISGRVSSCGCLISKGEYIIRQILLKNKVCFDTQYTFKDLKAIRIIP